MFIVLMIIILLAIISGFLMLWKIPRAVEIEKRLPVNKEVSVIIPARNEAHNLPLLLASLKKQRVQPREIIVVDDYSEDNTVQIAKTYGARVIQPNSGEEEWTGKSAACWKGAKAAQGEWFLFLDADTQFEADDSFERLLATYDALEGTGILSFQPYHYTEELYENLSPVFNIILMAGMNVFTPLGQRLKPAGAFGPCMIVAKEEYFLTGGHQAIAIKVLDDLAIGELYMENGLSVHCYSGVSMIQFRMYPDGLQQLLEGWTKGFGTAAGSTHPGVMTLISLWISGAFVSSGTLITSLFWGQSAVTVIAALLCVAYMLQFYWQARRIGNFHFLVAVCYPLLFIFFVGLFLKSLFLTKVLGKVKWRGRDIEV